MTKYIPMGVVDTLVEGWGGLTSEGWWGVSGDEGYGG